MPDLAGALTPKEQAVLFFLLSSNSGIQQDLIQAVLNHQQDAAAAAVQNLETDVDNLLTTDLGITDPAKRSTIIGLLGVMWQDNGTLRPALAADPATVAAALGFAYGPPPCPTGQDQLNVWSTLTT